MKIPAVSMLLLAAAIVLAGCSSPRVMPESGGLPSHAEEGIIGVPMGGDRLRALQGVTTAVLGVSETEAGRWDVSTRLVDPGGEDGSMVAQLATAVCEEAVRRGATGVSVLDVDGRPFVVYDVLVHGETCTEV